MRPDCAVHGRIDLAKIDHGNGLNADVVTAVIAAASPLALPAIEVRCVLPFRHEHARAAGDRAEQARGRATARIANRSFVRGGVPGVGHPFLRGCVGTWCGQDRRYVLGVELMTNASTIPRPQMEEMQ